MVVASWLKALLTTASARGESSGFVGRRSSGGGERVTAAGVASRAGAGSVAKVLAIGGLGIGAMGSSALATAGIAGTSLALALGRRRCQLGGRRGPHLRLGILHRLGDGELDDVVCRFPHPLGLLVMVGKQPCDVAGGAARLGDPRPARPAARRSGVPFGRSFGGSTPGSRPSTGPGPDQAWPCLNLEGRRAFGESLSDDSS